MAGDRAGRNGVLASCQGLIGYGISCADRRTGRSQTIDTQEASYEN